MIGGSVFMEERWDIVVAEAFTMILMERFLDNGFKVIGDN